MGEGNFTQVNQVLYKGVKMYAVKVCSMAKVKNLRKETDILMEKHALNKLRERYGEKEMPNVKLVGTFKDMENLYFIMEMLQGRNEMWLACRNFGLLSDKFTRATFREICKCVKKLHDVRIIHRDLKVSKDHALK